jgi:hypothetical protein
MRELILRREFLPVREVIQLLRASNREPTPLTDFKT